MPTSRKERTMRARLPLHKSVKGSLCSTENLWRISSESFSPVYDISALLDRNATPSPQNTFQIRHAKRSVASTVLRRSRTRSRIFKRGLVQNPDAHSRLFAILERILIAWCLVATTVFFHAALTIILNPVLRLVAQLDARFSPLTWLIVRVTWWLIVISHC
jgi:hypothetical protein